MKSKNSQIKECSYKVDGMHCASCEVLIEKKLIKQGKVEAVDASTANNEVSITYTGKKPKTSYLNSLFKSEGYSFSEKNKKMGGAKNGKKLMAIEDGALIIDKKKISSALFIVVGIIGLYLIYTGLQRLGITSLVNVDTNSALPVFFLFGLIAGLSSCAALVGGIVLSMSKQWYELHANSNSFGEKLQPHLLFNIGRILAFAVLGGVLGAIGSVFQLSPVFTAVLTIIVAIMMTMLGLQMLGVKSLQRFQFAMPKGISRYIADESNFAGKYMPFSMGALTFFLPCGFTITAQSLAMASGDPLRGALIMLLFALGTSPMLLFIGMSSTKLYEKTQFAENFLKLVGIIVIFFGLTTLNQQLSVLGLPNLSDINLSKSYAGTTSGSNNTTLNLPEIVDGKQIVKMNASSSGYDPNYITVRVGVPVRWEITDKGTSGCTNAIISQGLFDGQIQLTNGQVSVKEFTPTEVGKFRFSCWMGMVKGIIEVVDPDSPGAINTTQNDSDTTVVESGAKGCGCGGGGGTGSCGGSN